ncbi:MAG TPA: DUF6600 domain-containing protein [Burkholderiaceae bacterium]|nr:DUF6600 domain-containing protein [Burkholderiaceae bacterium]
MSRPVVRTLHAPTEALRWLHSLIGLTLACLALAASGSAWADPPGRVGRIADTSGNVWLFDDEEGDWVQPGRNRPVTEGNRVSTERGARAEVQVGSATLRLDGGTDIEFHQLDDSRVLVRLHGGSVALRARGDSAREFAVLTEEGRYEPLRAGRYRVDARDNGSFGAAITGQLRFEARDSVLDLNAGQRAEFWSERGVTHYAWASMPDDRFGDWVAREEREDDRERNRYVSPEMTGSEDLDRHGRWDRHPDYGAIWYPTAVVSGWAPYRYGHWAWVQPWGWTWVDDAPWGFAPFHYGRWVSYGGRWGWCPGQYVARPVYAPALVAWFGGSNVSVGISIGGPAVGWVPLGPREIYHPTYSVTNIYVRNVNVTHRNWHGPNPRYERTVPTGPIMYTNQGVAGGVTVVPQGVMRGRQPVANAAVAVDAKTVSRWQAPAATTTQAAVVPVAPPEPRGRAVASPGGAVPAAPGATRSTPWTAPGRVGAARGDGGEANRSPGRETRPEARIERPAQPVVPARPGAQPTPPRDTPDRAERGGERGRADEARGQQRSRETQVERRGVQPAAPAVQPAQPVQPVQPAQPTPAQRVQPMPAPVRGQREDKGERNERGERGDRNERGDDRGRGDVNRERQNR